MKLVTDWKRKARLTDAEYRAHITGINIVFGAVLGFVISGIEQLDPVRFGVILTLISGLVISILYIHASKHRLAYSIYTLLLIAALPYVVDVVVSQAEFALPPKLQPTLVVWTLITIFAEFYPREPAGDSGS